jgi:hypothetical protein
MAQFIATIVGLQVLAHSVLGCCADHWTLATIPQAADCSESRTHISKDYCHGHPHSHDRLSHDNGEDHKAPDEHDHCRHEGCQWLATKAGLQLDLHKKSGLLVSWPMAIPARSHIASEPHVNFRPSQRFLAPSLRTYLVLQVLLI